MRLNTSCLLLVAMCVTIAPINTFAQEGAADSDYPSQWGLTGISHGVTYEQSMFPKEYTVHTLDASGGDIEVRQWNSRRPECFQTRRLRWTFDRDVSEIRQDDEIRVDGTVTIEDENLCPYVDLRKGTFLRIMGGNGGGSGPSKYLGQESRSLIWGDTQRIESSQGGRGDGTLRVTDRSNIGIELNVPDGYFKVSLGGEYDVIYKFGSTGAGEGEELQGCSGGDVDNPSHWCLTGISHGVTYEQSMFPKEYTVHTLDASGGDIEVRQWNSRRPECFQTRRLRWTFDRDVSEIRQDDEIRVDGTVTIEDENLCPYVDLRKGTFLRIMGGNGGGSGPSKYLGQESRSLIWGDTQRIESSQGGRGDGTLRVTDRSNIGIELNVPDGYFKVSLGGEYDVIYKFGSTGETIPGGGTASAVDLGRRWNVVGAGGWTAVWTRRGESDTFDGVWTGPQGQRVTTVVTTVTIDGRNMTANRTQSSDGFLCRYTGQVASDGVTVRGSARCGATTFDWSATISGGRTGPPSGSDSTTAVDPGVLIEITPPELTPT